MRCLRRCCWLALLSHATAQELYARLNLTRSASAKDIKKAYYRAALQTHPDKVDEVEKEAATARFKAISEAYEVLGDDNLRRVYDASGSVPDGKARNARQRGSGDDGFGYEQQQQQQRRRQQQHYRRAPRRSYEQFEVNLAQQRMVRLHSLDQLRDALRPGSSGARYGLIGFVGKSSSQGAPLPLSHSPHRRLAPRRTCRRDGLPSRRAPPPRAAPLPVPVCRLVQPSARRRLLVGGGVLRTSMVGEDPRGREIARESRWEDVLQTFIVGGSDGGVARALGVETDGPAVAWVRIRRGDGEEGSGEGYPSAAELDVERFESDDGFVSWAYHKLAVEFEIVNEDHRPLRCWWINGRSASKMGEVLPGESWRRVPPLAREAPALLLLHTRSPVGAGTAPSSPTSGSAGQTRPQATSWARARRWRTSRSTTSKRSGRAPRRSGWWSSQSASTRTAAASRCAAWQGRGERCSALTVDRQLRLVGAQRAVQPQPRLHG